MITNTTSLYFLRGEKEINADRERKKPVLYWEKYIEKFK